MNVSGPVLDPAGLQNNGGATKTIALVQGPAVDRSKNVDALPTDQRGAGIPRTYDNPNFNNAIPGTVADLERERRPLYEGYADFTIACGDEPADAVAARIIERLV